MIFLALARLRIYYLPNYCLIQQYKTPKKFPLANVTHVPLMMKMHCNAGVPIVMVNLELVQRQRRFTPTICCFRKWSYCRRCFIGHHFTKVILDDSSLKCWGYNTYGQLGLGNSSGTNSVPSLLILAAAAQHLRWLFGNLTLSNTWYGSLKCWGKGSHGQLGLGHSVTLYSPQS